MPRFTVHIGYAGEVEAEDEAAAVVAAQAATDLRITTVQVGRIAPPIQLDENNEEIPHVH